MNCCSALLAHCALLEWSKTLVELREAPPPSLELATRAHLHKPPFISLVTTYSKRTYAHPSLPSALGEIYSQTHTCTPNFPKPTPTCLLRQKDLWAFACQRESCWISSFRYVIPAPQDHLQCISERSGLVSIASNKREKFFFLPRL